MKPNILSLAIVMLIFQGIGAIAFEWNSHDSIYSEASGPDEVRNIAALVSTIDADDIGIHKNVAMINTIAGASEVKFNHYSMLEVYLGGHRYTQGFNTFDTIKLPIDTEIILAREGNIDVNKNDMVAPLISSNWELSIPEFAGKPIRSDTFEIDVPSLVRQFTDIGSIEFSTGYELPMSESYEGVTCEWGRGQSIEVSVI